MSHAYRLSGLKLISDVELPELMPWEGWCEAPVDLVFRLGKVAPQLDKSDDVSSQSQTKRRERYLLGYSDNTQVSVANGREMTIEPAPGTGAVEIRAVLMGPAQAVLWHQRGLLPLHASAVALNGRAVALAGHSGAGKSTLAAVLSAKGLSVIADDISVIDTSNGADVLPSTPRLRLWRDTLEHLGIEIESLPRALPRREKYLKKHKGWVGPDRQKLVAVVILSRQTRETVAIERLRGARSIIELQDLVHMRSAARALGLEAAIFTALTHLVPAGVTVWRLVMPDDPACLDLAAAEVLTMLDGRRADSAGP